MPFRRKVYEHDAWKIRPCAPIRWRIGKLCRGLACRRGYRRSRIARHPRALRPPCDCRHDRDPRSPCSLSARAFRVPLGGADHLHSFLHPARAAGSASQRDRRAGHRHCLRLPGAHGVRPDRGARRHLRPHRAPNRLSCPRAFAHARAHGLAWVSACASRCHDPHRGARSRPHSSASGDPAARGHPRRRLRLRYQPAVRHPGAGVVATA